MTGKNENEIRNFRNKKQGFSMGDQISVALLGLFMHRVSLLIGTQWRIKGGGGEWTVAICPKSKGPQVFYNNNIITLKAISFTREGSPPGCNSLASFIPHNLGPQ